MPAAPFVLSEKFFEAARFAAELHAGQRRKTNGAPYFAHLLGTAAIVLEYGGTEDEAIVALLHDAVEDQGGAPTQELIREKFGEWIATRVDLCTMRKTYKNVPDDRYAEERIKSQETYLLQLASDRSALLIGLCDKIYNARSLVADLSRVRPEIVWAPFRGGSTLAIKLFEMCGTALSCLSWLRETAPIWELAHLVEELKTRSKSQPQRDQKASYT